MELLRPAIQLVPGSPGTSAVARLGGLPYLPESEDWPTWPGHGPLSYVGEIACELVAANFPLDVDLPSSGRLLFFYFDGSYDNFATTVGTWDASTLMGARALHVSDDDLASQRSTPLGVTTYIERHFDGRPIMTAPGWEHDDLRAAFKAPGQDHRSFMDHPVNADDFVEALHERHTGTLHQIGGYAEPVQGPVEHEVALAALDNQVPHGDPRLDEEARHWELVLQVDSDDDLGMMWGDEGVLYWMTRVDQSPSGFLAERMSFTWQCG
ncbi:YwqG family protein [Aeromicrobium sp.]|uniref:YwqG family protein n=1 Tax=Aeromicrobium sp. TaxID=1871063 RepID=UPI00199EB497|nr:YwqG family protein [Aeromicrobium sp.]MBC7631104.1 DUF1963 domain-containing protein [Aeromicrobium sp.]